MHAIPREVGASRPASFRLTRVVGVGAAIALGLGTFLPWLVATDTSLGVTVSWPGFEAGSSGLLVLALAIIAGITLALGTRFTARVAALVGAVALVVTGFDLSPSPDLIAYLGLPGNATLGIGIWISLVGAVGVLIMGLYGAITLRDT